jgi:hypothetical protein
MERPERLKKHQQRGMKYAETKLLLACGSFVVFAGLTAFIANRAAPTDDVYVERGELRSIEGIVVRDGDDEVILVPAPIEAPRPIARTRGT